MRGAEAPSQAGQRTNYRVTNEDKGSVESQLRASRDVQGINRLTIAGHTGILRHLCPSAFQPGSGDRGSKSVEAVLSGRHEGSNLQAVDGRSRIGSGFAWMTTADSHDSRPFPTLQLKNRQPFSQITKYTLS
jgi:hypothetical protein